MMASSLRLLTKVALLENILMPSQLGRQSHSHGNPVGCSPGSSKGINRFSSRHITIKKLELPAEYLALSL